MCDLPCEYTCVVIWTHTTYKFITSTICKQYVIRIWLWNIRIVYFHDKWSFLLKPSAFNLYVCACIDIILPWILFCCGKCSVVVPSHSHILYFTCSFYTLMTCCSRISIQCALKRTVWSMYLPTYIATVSNHYVLEISNSFSCKGASFCLVVKF